MRLSLNVIRKFKLKALQLMRGMRVMPVLGAVTVASVLAGCSSDKVLPVVSCPVPAILADTEIYHAATGDVKAELGKVALACRVIDDGDRLETRLFVGGRVYAAAPLAASRSIELPVFIAVLSADDEILQRRDVTFKVSLGAGKSEDNTFSSFGREFSDLEIALNGQDINGYQVLVGFRLDAQGVEKNRRDRRRSLRM